MRLDHYLSAAGLGSRSDVKKLISKGLISVDGTTVKDSGYKVDELLSRITYNGATVSYAKNVYFMLNKPKGVISASRADLRNQDETCVVDLISEEKHRGMFPIGRLDKDTEGLLIISDDGILAHNLLSPKKHVDKTYYAELKSELSLSDKEHIESGIDIGDDTPTLPAKIETINKTSVYITIHEGRYHEIKRMFEAVGNEVTFLKRISMGPLKLDPTLNPGEYRRLTDEELSLLI
ncbi:MAG: pseudouridine synthase [Lachnospiraceae bacterium]|nr:pseudouridine synthase [Lachnospiraceae bacterium]